MSRTLTVSTALLFLLGLAGCPGEPCFLTRPVTNPPSMLLVGTPSRVPIAPFIEGECGGPNDVMPASLTVEITDPDHQPVPHQAQLGNPPSAVANIEFTPTKPGLYHVFAAFDPIGGLHQFDIHSVRDRTAEAPLVTMPTTCRVLERTSRGAWVCNTEIIRDNVVLDRLTSSTVAVSGDVLWVADSRQVHRYEDDGTRVRLVASVDHHRSQPEFLLASENELVVLHEDTFQRIVFDGAKLASTGLTSWGLSFAHPLEPRGILLRRGDQLGLVFHPFANSHLFQVCAYQLEAGRFVRTAEDCQVLPGGLAGFEPGVFWMLERPGPGTGNTLHRMVWTGSRLVTQGTLPLGGLQPSLFFDMKRPTIAPVLRVESASPGRALRTAVPVHIPGEEVLQLEHLDSEIFDAFATHRFYWGHGTSISQPPGVRIRIRPSTP